MPTATGLPKVGEVWERTYSLPKRGDPTKWETDTVRFVVLSRGKGDYWSMRVYVPGQTRSRRGDLWVDPANAFRLGELKYLREASDETRSKLGLPPGPKRKAAAKPDKPVDRITWTPHQAGGWDGRPGKSIVPMFSISYRLVSKDPTYRLTTVLPGMTRLEQKLDDPDKLKVIAERWLETFANRIGFDS